MRNVKTSWLQRITALKKMVFCAFLSVCVFVICFILQEEIQVSLMLSWNTFSLSMIGLSWVVFFTTDADQLCVLVRKQDETMPVIFFIVLVTVCFSLFGIVGVLMNPVDNVGVEKLHTFISLFGVGLSWTLLHTIFTFRYAHLYHDHNKLKTGSQIGGIDFPGKDEPDYFDFAYFSFVIGMTFQVSDVRVTSTVIRRFVLMHGLISFVFNAIIVALTINTIANLKK